MTPDERFWTHVDRAGEDCWPWLGAQDGRGYGMVWWDGRSQRAHRIAYGLVIGEIPQGLHLDHLCRNRICVNPSHLEPVTGRTNSLRGFGVGGLNAAKTHCKRGHLFDEENTFRFLTPGGFPGRACRACRPVRSAELERARKHYQALADELARSAGPLAHYSALLAEAEKAS